MTSETELSRFGPVHFQPLVLELAQVAAYISGITLNAGCGNRDISTPLKCIGAESIVNYDIQSDIPGAIIGSLDQTPFEDDAFDTIFCNAVLEHVPDVTRVMNELRRILKPNGRLVVGMPFLQPYHECPTDFRRFTRDGLVELGQLNGLDCIAIHPVHNICQTIGWIAWEWAKEKGKFPRIVLYPIIWLMTRIFFRTDHKVVRNANTFQVVYKKQDNV